MATAQMLPLGLQMVMPDRLELIDPSDFRPEGKPREAFRQHLDPSNPRYSLVKATYEDMHTKQTVDYVRSMVVETDWAVSPAPDCEQAYWLHHDKARLPVIQALQELNRLVDDSDPDISLPNIMHAFQTAERIRQVHPDKEWLHLTGLIHDLGKIMALWGQPQWSTVGDTFPVGAQFSDSIVFAESFASNPDTTDPRYNTLYGMYAEHCGLDNVLMSWGHDEYLYHVLKGNNCTLPLEALYIIRFHSFYPWHTSRAYGHLCSAHDAEMLAWVNEFNKFDLYSKSDAIPDMEVLLPYYQGLIDKYCPGDLRW